MSRVLLWTKLVLGAGLCFSCAGILGIEEATCLDQFSGCPGFTADAGNGHGDGDDTGDGDGDDTGDGDTEDDGGVGDDAGADASDAAEPVDPEALCDEYCGEIIDNCVADADIQYPSYEFCMNVCDHFELGDPEDQTGNTLYCRLKRARDAAFSEPETLCQIAGPSGGGVCGESICDNVCDMALEICDEFASRTACMTDCEALPDVMSYNSGFDSGLDVQCRQYHVNAAATDALVHCPHVGGAGPCSHARP